MFQSSSWSEELFLSERFQPQARIRRTAGKRAVVTARAVSLRALKHGATNPDPSSRARVLVSKAVEAVSKAVEVVTAEEAVGPEGAGVVVEAEAMLPVVVVRPERATTVEKSVILRLTAPTDLSKRGQVVGLILRLPRCSIRPGHGTSHSNHSPNTKANIQTL